MSRKMVFTDVDGVLLNMNEAFWRSVSEVVDKPSYGVVHHWDYRQVAGLCRSDELAVWRRIWDTPLVIYEDAEELIDYCLKHKIRMVACSVRPEGPAKEAALRDFPRLNIPFTTFETHKTKTDFVLRMGESWDDDFVYVEDHWETADIVSRNSIKTYLIDTPYNSSRDLTTKYERTPRHDLIRRLNTWFYYRGLDE